MDKPLIRQRFARAVATYPRQAAIQQTVAARMAGLVRHYVPQASCRRTLEVGCGTGLFTRRLLKAARPEQLWLNDLCPEVADCFADLPAERVRFLSGDAEHIRLPEGQGLIASCSALQWFARPEAFLQRCTRLLADTGYLAFSTFGRDNLRELTALTGQGLPYRSLDQLCRTLAPDFDLLFAHEERFVVRFATPTDVLRHLRETGVTGLRRQHWTKADLADFSERYVRRFGTPTADGTSVPLTYHPLYIIAKKKQNV